VTAVDLFDAFAGTPTLVQLQQYNIVVAFSNNAYNDAVGMGNVLADYADTGGIVVGLNFDWFGPPFGLDGRWITGGYTPFNTGPTNFTSSCLGTYNVAHPLMQGISAGSLCAFFRHTLTLSAGAVSVAQYQDSQQLCAYKTNNGHTGVGINAYLGANPENFSGPFGRVIVNAGRWLLAPPCGTPTPTPTASPSATFTPTPTPTALPCNNYTTSTTTGNTIVPGTTDTGNHCDDCTTNINFPFPVYVYGTSFNSGLVSSNGNLQLTGNTSYLGTSCPLPDASLLRAVLPYQDDLRTDQVSPDCASFPGGCGVFTSTTGTAPNRQFNVEWRAGYFGRTGTANFEVVFYENQQSFFDIFYAVTVDNGSSEESGVQASATGPATTFSCRRA